MEDRNIYIYLYVVNQPVPSTPKPRRVGRTASMRPRDGVEIVEEGGDAAGI